MESANAHELAAAGSRLDGGPDGSRAMGSASRRFLTTYFDSNVPAQRYLDMLGPLVAG